MTEHEHIWLQLHDDDTTWCQDKINEDDVEYVHGDLFAQLEANLRTQARKALRLKTENETLGEIQHCALELCNALPTGAYPNKATGDKCELLAETIRTLTLLIEKSDLLPEDPLDHTEDGMESRILEEK